VQDHLEYIVNFLERHKLQIMDVKKALGLGAAVRIFWDFDMTISFAISDAALRSFADVIDGVEISIT